MIPGGARKGGRGRSPDDKSLTFGDGEAPVPVGISVGVGVTSPPEATGIMAVLGLNAAEAGIGTVTEEGGKAG